MNSIKELLTSARERLQFNSSPGLDTELLLGHAMDVNRTFLFAHADEQVTPAAAARFQQLLAKRLQGRPVAQLLGRREFWSLEIRVNEHTLIPRPETEHLVETVLDLMPANNAYNMADLGTGSGAIALAVASEHPLAKIVATDISTKALTVARHNAARLGMENIHFTQGSWCVALQTALFEIIVSNPPYIEEEDPVLEQEELKFEPRSALAAGSDGLDDIRIIIRQAQSHLRSGGWLVLEHGYNQAQAIREILQDFGYVAIETRRDHANHERITLAMRP